MNFKSGHHQHTHPGDPGAELKASTRAFVKKSALEFPFASSGKIVKKALSSCENSDVSLPNINTLVRCTNRAREGQRPKHPEDISFELNTDHVPQDFLQADLFENGQRHLIFAKPIQLQHLSKSKVWYMDGTFKIVRTRFVLLLSVHSFIKKDGIMKQVPLCFVLMSRRKKNDYVAVIRKITDLTSTSVCEVALDFERALWSAVRVCIPEASLHGCWFHWAQAVYRRVKRLGLENAYINQLSVRQFIRQIMATWLVLCILALFQRWVLICYRRLSQDLKITSLI